MVFTTLFHDQSMSLSLSVYTNMQRGSVQGVSKLETFITRNFKQITKMGTQDIRAADLFLLKK